MAAPMPLAVLIQNAGVTGLCSQKGYLTPFRQNSEGSPASARHVWIRIKRRQSKIKSPTVNPVRLFFYRYDIVLKYRRYFCNC
jgi:hypothetical protein